MNVVQRISLAASLLTGLCLSSGTALAQSTDGYHSIQVFPLVVDTLSFATRLNFRNPNPVSLTIKNKFFPAIDTGQAAIGPLVCNNVVVAAGKTATIGGLRVLCPGLPLGTSSQFGFLVSSEVTNGSLPFAGFARIANPLGNGHTVEAYPAHTFTAADSVVNGIRRLAKTASDPAYQTNCFIGNLNEIAPPGVPSITKVQYTVYDSSSNVVGAAGTVDLAPGQIVRLLDIFTKVGMPSGNYNDAQFKVEELNANLTLGEPGIISYCTVQDNAFFGADFRIGKQELGAGGLSYPGDVIGGQDSHVARQTLVSADGVGRNFAIGTGVKSNTHVIYFRHPDYVQCELIDPADLTGTTRLLSAYGLEMRMLDQNGVVIAGGNNVTGWSEVYLGDKTTRNSGANSRYTIEVEDSQVNTASLRAYKLHCQSGSGHTLGDIIRYQEATGRF